MIYDNLKYGFNIIIDRKASEEYFLLIHRISGMIFDYQKYDHDYICARMGFNETLEIMKYPVNVFFTIHE